MKAAQARRLAKNVKAGKVKETSRPTELDEILNEVTYAAGRGDLNVRLDQDMILNDSTPNELEKLGYSVDYIQSRPTSRPYWVVSWERKAA